jgi:hypothetical protein
MHIQDSTIKAYKTVYKTSKQNHMESDNYEVLKRLGSGKEQSSDFEKIVYYLSGPFEKMKVNIRAYSWKRSFWCNEEYIMKIQVLQWLVRNSETAKIQMLSEFQNHEKIPVKIFICFIQITMFISHKTFFDSRWLDQKLDFALMRQFIQDLNENNFREFKQFFGERVPKLAQREFNPEGLTYAELY